MGFPTPDSLPTETICRQVTLPNDPIFTGAFTGALLTLTIPQNWEQFGAVTPDEAAYASLLILNRYLESDVCMIGAIVAYATSSAPPGMLPCEGGVYLREDYPNLYAAIDPIYHLDADSFTVPDLRGRTVIGAGEGPMLTDRAFGSVAGEETHTLTELEIPAHSHTEITAIAAVINGGIEAPAAAATPSAGVTGTTGGGGAHNNMQPYVALRWGIVAR